MNVIETHVLKEISGGGLTEFDQDYNPTGIRGLEAFKEVWYESSGAYVFETMGGDIGSINFRDSGDGGVWEYNLNGDTSVAWLTFEGNQATLEVMTETGEMASTTFTLNK